MEEYLQIGCPKCGTILSVKYQYGIESKTVTCPVCKKNTPFVNFRRIVAKNGDDHTQYPGEEETHYETDKTTPNDAPNFTLGKIVVPSANLSFQLQVGKNIIGRRANGSSAHVQIPTTTKRMSREHLVIEVKKVAGKGFVHYLSLNKQQVNPTFIGNVPLEYGDKIVLKHLDTIKLPDMEVRFEIPDEEGTEF